MGLGQGWGDHSTSTQHLSNLIRPWDPFSSEHFCVTWNSFGNAPLISVAREQHFPLASSEGSGREGAGISSRGIW